MVHDIETKAKEAVENAKTLERKMGANFEDDAKSIADQE
jgi:hypothetical protein